MQTLCADNRRPAPGQECGEHLNELALVDRAAAQLEIDRDVRRDRRRGGQRLDIVRPRIDGGDVVVDIGEIAQRLDAAGRGAGADGDQKFRLLAHFKDALRVVLRRDRAFDQGKIVRPLRDGARCFREIRDLDRAGDREQFILAIEQGKLASVAGRELPDREPGTRACRHVKPPGARRCARPCCRAPPAHPCRRSPGRTGSGRTARWRTSCCAPLKGKSAFR